MPNYISTYIVTGSEITTIIDGTQPLSQYAGQQVYLYISTGTNQSARCTIDVAKYMLFEQNINYTQTMNTLASSLTDLQIAGYTTTDLPTVNIADGAFDSRLNAIDAVAASDLNIQYTSIYTPDVRNLSYQRDILDDLVISSSTGRNFANSLVSVNGVFHKTFFYQNELYVKSGFSNIRTCKKTKIALYDTSTLGGHTIVPITLANIDVSNTAYFSGVTLTFPSTNFTNTTPMLVINGYLFPPGSVFRLINNNRMIIDTCKLDFINMFLNDPNTLLVADNILSEAEAVILNGELSVADEITYYLKTMYPTALSGQSGDTSFLQFTAYQPVVTAPITPADMINYFLKNWPYDTTAVDNTMLSQYSYYKLPTSIVTTLPITDFTNEQYVIDLLTSERSFIIMINNPAVYTRTYDLQLTDNPDQYVAYGDDTPRGMLMYNRSMAIPYLTLADENRPQHSFSLDYVKTTNDVYKTIINPQSIPSPKLDTKSYKRYPVRLIEFYAA